MIAVDNLKMQFGSEEILKGISTVFEQGKTNLIIGQSGSGKSVLLKCLIGLLKPVGGIISYHNKPTDQMNLQQQRILREEIGMLFQGGALFDSMTIEENIMFPLRMFSNQSKSKMISRVNEVLNRVNLDGVNTKYPAEISGGMQKRVSIARAIVNNPKYLFCDEPNSGLDPKTATVIDNLIQKITHENDITAIVVTHDMNSVMEIGERINFLKNGILVWKGTQEDIFKTNNQDVTDFVYSSNLFKKIRDVNKISS
ncbi:MAG: Methionine import ATP-binding protein MetN [Flavobacteriaceae bacterium]|nr:MAG: Methionine import ATP-binding protein MetN [Flavobacteriaceae bacterium]